ncbi:MAG: hydroxyisourate hydrolase [Gemmatimonadales bacterium]|nr:hydroxyisourate hydrolase [Gemmatimonadales bacterium]
MTRITSHVLDTSAGRPASGMAVRLERAGAAAEPLAMSSTDRDGRIGDWLPGGVPAGGYRLVFETGAWFRSAGRESLYARVVIEFEVRDGVPHYHLPLLLSPFGYSTYRGS